MNQKKAVEASIEIFFNMPPTVAAAQGSDCQDKRVNNPTNAEAATYAELESVSL